MEKKTFNATNLVCQFQTTSERLDNNGCLNGVISRTDDGFRFEEAVKAKSVRRNPKLYDGRYISLVRKSNRRYQIHTRTIDPSEIKEIRQWTNALASELLDALDFIYDGVTN